MGNKNSMRTSIRNVFVLFTTLFFVFNYLMPRLTFAKCSKDGSLRIHSPISLIIEGCQSDDGTKITKAKCCKIIRLKECTLISTIPQSSTEITFFSTPQPGVADYSIGRDNLQKSFLLSSIPRSHSPPRLVLFNLPLFIQDNKLLI